MWGNLTSFRKSGAMDHALHSFWTADSVVTEGFLSSAPKPPKQTRRPRPKPKTTTTTEAPQTKLGKCGLKGLSPSSFGDPGIGVPGGSESQHGPSVGKGTTYCCGSHCWAHKEIHGSGKPVWHLNSLYFPHKDPVF